MFEINIHDFYNAYNTNYTWLYDGGDESSDYHEMVAAGDALIAELNKSNPAFLSEWNQYRQDLMISDREVAAFALTWFDFVNEGSMVEVTHNV